MEERRSGGMKLDSVLLTIFIVLKLTGNIAWRWIWVLSPLWISLFLVIFIRIIELLLDDDK